MLTLLVLWSVLTGAAATIEGKVCSLLPKSYEIEFVTVSLQRLLLQWLFCICYFVCALTCCYDWQGRNSCNSSLEAGVDDMQIEILITH